MSVTAIKLSPEIASAGQEVTVLPIGTVSPDTDLRYYLLSAPPSSALDTLATYEADGKSLADIRLRTKDNGQGVFTPDVPGQYLVVIRPVTVYKLIPSYGGEVPSGSNPAATDNEEGPFTVDASVTAQVSDVPAYGESLWVYETLSRAVGFGQDTATLAVKVYNNRVVNSVAVSDEVTLSAGSTAPSKTAVYDASVESVLEHIRAITANGHRELAYHAAVLRALIRFWNNHLGLDTYKVHTTVADSATDLLASTANVSASLSSIGTRLDDIVAKYNAHRVRLTDPTTSGLLHPSADNTNVMTAGSVADLASAIAYYEHVLLVLQAHGTDRGVHVSTPTTYAVDGYFGWCAEPPRSLAELASAINGESSTRWENFGLTSLYESHRIRATVKVHSTADSLDVDTSNTVNYLSATPADLYQTANALADAIARHIKNQDSTGQDAATPYHFTNASRSRLPTRRASDARSFALCVEELWVCLESHTWSAGPSSGYDTDTAASTRGQHPDRAWGLGAIGNAPNNSSRPMAMIRLAKAFDAALSDGTATEEQAALGYLASQMRLLGGFSLPSRLTHHWRAAPSHAPPRTHGICSVQAQQRRRLHVRGSGHGAR